MKTKNIFALAVLTLLGCTTAFAQSRTLNLDQSLNGTTILGPTNGLTILDDGGSGNYSAGYDYYVVIEGDCDVSSSDTAAVLCIDIVEDQLSILSTDTLYIYDGGSTSSPCLMKINSSYRSNPSSRIYPSQNNTDNKLTVRFYSKMSTTDKDRGFNLHVDCGRPCEYIHPVIDTLYEHINLRTGEVIRSLTFRKFASAFDSIFNYDTTRVADTIWDDTASGAFHIRWHDTILRGDLIRVDTIGYVDGATNCIGQGIRLHGHGEYTNLLGYYTPSDETSTFIWQLQNGDTIRRVGLTTLDYGGLQSTGCTKVGLTIIDEHECVSKEFVQIEVRVAQNPIKTIFDLTPICNDQYCPVSVGVGDPNSTLNLRKINFEQTYSQTNAVRTFIPDGPQCAHTDADKCYHAPVVFDSFHGKTVTSASDICSICINYEHTFMGDYRLALSCPTYDENNPSAGGLAVLKYGKSGGCSTCDPLAPSDSPDGSGAGGGDDTGCPHSSNTGCDSLNNPYGIGLDYCWSRNSAYTLITGDLASVPTRFQPGDWYISKQHYTSIDTTIPNTESYFNNTGGGRYNSRTRTPSDHDGKADYYSPASDFSELIGCPMDGEWNVWVCDFWGGDNGWVFSWTLDFCGIASAQGSCVYQVAVDSVTWRPDTNYVTDFRDGEYKGLRIDDIDSVNSRIYSPDTAGDFRIKLKIYDEFGCVWDTLTRISTVHTPLPSLGEDVTLCGADSVMLNGYDGYEGIYYNYKYAWEPFGEKTPTVYTKKGLNGTHRYIVGVTNSYLFGGTAQLNCEGRDTINVSINDQPILSFDPGVYPLEGCEPFVLDIKNTTKYGYKYRWEFGDGVITTQKEPRHAYAAGQYTLKYYVESDKGCKDSLIFDSLVTVFPNPTAAFSWQPEFPTVLHPEIQLINNTTPQTDNSKYFWEVQYDRNHPNSYSTLLDKDPVYRWTSKTGEDVTGDYIVRLISRTDNVGPSGHVVQCADTVESTILLINDLLEFPSVVTPNGDGYNDRFVIRGLVEGLGYQINTLDIYDKWGSRVFHADNISKDEEFWDPAKTNAPTGTYFYRFIGRGQAGTIEHNGVIEVLR